MYYCVNPIMVCQNQNLRKYRKESCVFESYRSHRVCHNCAVCAATKILNSMHKRVCPLSETVSIFINEVWQEGHISRLLWCWKH